LATCASDLGFSFFLKIVTKKSPFDSNQKKNTQTNTLSNHTQQQGVIIIKQKPFSFSGGKKRKKGYV